MLGRIITVKTVRAINPEVKTPKPIPVQGKSGEGTAGAAGVVIIGAETAQTVNQDIRSMRRLKIARVEARKECWALDDVGEQVEDILLCCVIT